MPLVPKPAPRRLVLGGLVFLALGLRLWGIGWSPPSKEELGALEVLQRIMSCGPGAAGPVGEAFYLLAAGWNWLLAGLEQVGCWLGSAGAGPETGPGVVAARVLVAVGASAAVGLCWAAARRWFFSVGTAAIGAAMVATSPLLVALGHILAPEGMAPLAWGWAAWMGWLLATRVGALECFWAGICTGLVASGVDGGVLAAVSTWWGYWAGVRTLRPGKMKAWVLWPLAGLAGVVVGVGLGAPGVVLRPLEAVGNLAGMWQGWGVEGVGLRAVETARCVIWGGPGVVWGLAGVGATVLLRARDWTRMGLAVGAGLGLVGAIVGPWKPAGIVGGASLLAAIVGAWPVVVACRRAGKYRAQVAAAAGAGVVVCAVGTYISLVVAHGFWRPTSWEVAQGWIERNLPPGAHLWLGKGVSPHALAVGRPIGSANPRKGFLVELASTPQFPVLRIKRFRGLEGWVSALPGLPKGLSPPLALYALMPPMQVLEPLALPRLPAATREQWRVVGPLAAYEKDEGVAWLDSPGAKTRALSWVPAGVVGVELAEAQETYSQVKVCIGPWCTREMGLYPGQQVLLLLGPRHWPPLPGALVPVEIQLKTGGGVWARVVSDPLAIASAAARVGDWQSVVKVSSELLNQGEGGFETRVLTGLGLVRLGQMDRARTVLGPVAIAGIAPCFALGAQWDKVARSCGYEPGLLWSAVGIACNVEGPPCVSGGRVVPLRGRGWHGLYTRTHPLGRGRLSISLEEPLPAGVMELVAEFSSPEPDGKLLAELKVWVEELGRKSLVKSTRVVARRGGVWKERISLPVELPGSRLRLTLCYISGELKLSRVWIGPSVQAHIKQVLARYYEATGLVQLAAKRLKPATASLAKAMELNPGSWRLSLALTEALAEAGELAKAKEWARRTKGAVWNFPEGLKRLEAVCKRLKLEDLVQELAGRLGYLRPSLKHEAQFACGLKLLGYDLPVAKVRRGEHLKVSYYWQATSRVPTNYFIFVHLRGTKRTLNFDHLLAGGKVEMNRLAPGQVVRENYKLSIPSSTPAGRYRLVVGLWDARFTGKKVMITKGQEAGAHQVMLGEIEVLP